MHDLNKEEQDALLWLCSLLLSLDWPVSPANKERLALTWLDWRDQWNENVVPAPAVEIDSNLQQGQSSGDLEQLSRSPDRMARRTVQAIEVLQYSGNSRMVIPFLTELAKSNGINQKEAQFLRELELRLTSPHRQGIYR